MTQDPKTLALAYLDAVGSQRCDDLIGLLAPDLRFCGPSMTRSTAVDFIDAVKRLGVIHLRNELKRVFVDGAEVCIIYDFVTDTEAGALAMIEWLTVEGDRIKAINLYYDRLPWQAVAAEMKARGARIAGAA